MQRRIPKFEAPAPFHFQSLEKAVIHKTAEGVAVCGECRVEAINVACGNGVHAGGALSFQQHIQDRGASAFRDDDEARGAGEPEVKTCLHGFQFDAIYGNLLACVPHSEQEDADSRHRSRRHDDIEVGRLGTAILVRQDDLQRRRTRDDPVCHFERRHKPFLF